MPQAVVDPDELRQFARALKKFNTELQDRLVSLNNQLSALETTWRDQEQKKFAQMFDEHVKIIGRFVEASDKHVPYLMRKADQIDEYLQG
jgi:WXG100 family type VII secretion target